jgi:PAS domain S-box-containing protein
MNEYRYGNPQLFESFIKSSQYLVRLKTQQDIWAHLGKFIATHFPTSWTAFARRDSKGRIIVHHCSLPLERKKGRLTTDEVRQTIADVLDSGFLATRTIAVPGPSMTAFLPVVEDYKTASVMLIGHDTDEPVPADLLNIYLAIAGLAGTTSERLNKELELKRHRTRLEELVKERTAELTQAKRQNELILQSVGEGICGIDLEGKITFVNPSAARIIGWGQEELIGRNAHATFHHTRPDGCVYPEDECPVRLALQSGNTENVTSETFLRKDGSSFPVEFITTPIVEDGDTIGAVIIFRDITERRRSDEAILRAKEEWELTFDTVPDLMMILDTQHRLVRVNKATADRLGLTPEQCIGIHCHEAVHGLPHPPEYCPHSQTCRDGKEHVTDVHEPRLGGDFLVSTTPMLDRDGKLIGSIHVARDITERKRAEEELLREKNLTDTVMDSLPGVFYLFNDQGNFLRWNKNFQAVTGYSADEITKIHPVDLFEGADKTLVTKAILEVLDRGQATVEAGFVSKHGKKTPYFLTGNLIMLGQMRCVVGMGIDITERRLSEEEIRRLNENLQQRASELEASNRELEAFSYSVSHDLRAPLRHMEAYSQIVLEEYADKLDENGREYLQTIISSSERMAELIDNLLNLSRITRAEVHLEKVDLSELAGEVVNELESAQPERDVEWVIAPGVESYGDRQLLKLVLENLLGNALKFTGKNPAAKIEFGIKRSGNEKACFVRDNGVGFNMAYADKLFQPFQRLHKEKDFSGTGIGLASVHRIISRLGGRVWAEAEIDKGATFYFTLRRR